MKNILIFTLLLYLVFQMFIIEGYDDLNTKLQKAVEAALVGCK